MTDSEVREFIKVLKREKVEKILTYLMFFAIGLMVGILLALQLGVIRYEAVEEGSRFIIDNNPENLIENIPEDIGGALP